VDAGDAGGAEAATGRNVRLTVVTSALQALGRFHPADPSPYAT
jgi:hypothetical protein